MQRRVQVTRNTAKVFERVYFFWRYNAGKPGLDLLFYCMMYDYLTLCFGVRLEKGLAIIGRRSASKAGFGGARS
jgi:hypothetical protein